MEDYITSYVSLNEEDISIIVRVFENRFKTSSNWSVKKVDINDIIPFCKYVYEGRLLFAKKSIFNCMNYSIPLLYPYEVNYSNGKKHLVIPPIVEIRNDKLYLVDGMHRIYSLLKLNIREAYVLITSNCVLPLPGNIQSWEDVVIKDVQVPYQMNFDNFNKEGFTGYSKFCNSDLFWNDWRNKFEL